MGTKALSLLKTEFFLSISPQDYLKYYQGQVQWVLVTSVQGLKVKFPANLLREHVTKEGVSGRFILHYWSDGKAKSLEKVY